MSEFLVPNNIEKDTVRNFLQRNIGFSLTTWRKVKQNGGIKVNGTPALPNTMISSGDRITVDWPSDCTISPIDLPINIKYEDDYLLVIDKPANMLVHPAKYTDTETLANAIIYYYQQNDLAYGFHPVHRLDRNTSGLVLIAKLPYVQHLLAENNIKKVRRLYWCVAEGTITPSCGVIDTPIQRHPDSIIERIVHPDGQPAITIYRLLKELRKASLLEIELKTGRTHQIRVHLSSIGHPLLGDDLYGGSTKLINRQALHALRLTFVHPVTGEIVDVTTSPPSDFQQLIQLLSK